MMGSAAVPGSRFVTLPDAVDSPAGGAEIWFTLPRP